ncbi:MAG: OB-fold putative lipoprotein, partial [Treponema sp.]|nr:OB-fold putative lipoprotein [Treponema sp.]
TAEQIQQAAETLGVPLEALTQLVDTYRLGTVPDDIISISAVDFCSANTSNEARAKLLYDGKQIQITGRISSISSSNIELYGVSYYTVYVYFRDEELAKIANLSVGQTVTFVGIGKTSSYMPSIRDAYLVEVQ